VEGGGIGWGKVLALGIVSLMLHLTGVVLGAPLGAMVFVSGQALGPALFLWPGMAYALCCIGAVGALRTIAEALLWRRRGHEVPWRAFSRMLALPWYSGVLWPVLAPACSFFALYRRVLWQASKTEVHL